MLPLFFITLLTACHSQRAWPLHSATYRSILNFMTRSKSMEKNQSIKLDNPCFVTVTFYGKRFIANLSQHWSSVHNRARFSRAEIHVRHCSDGRTEKHISKLTYVTNYLWENRNQTIHAFNHSIPQSCFSIFAQFLVLYQNVLGVRDSDREIQVHGNHSCNLKIRGELISESFKNRVC